MVRGLSLSRDDLIRRSVIMANMCQGEVSIEGINESWLIDFKTYFARELEMLESKHDEGMVVVSDGAITVTAQGWYFVRGVAMVFDKYWQAGSVVRFSKII